MARRPGKSKLSLTKLNDEREDSQLEDYVKREHGTYKGHRIREVMKGTNSTHSGLNDFEVSIPSPPGNIPDTWIPQIKCHATLEQAKAWIDKQQK